MADKLYVWKAVFTATPADRAPTEWLILAFNFEAAFGKLRKAIHESGVENSLWEIHSLEKIGPLAVR